MVSNLTTTKLPHSSTFRYPRSLNNYVAPLLASATTSFFTNKGQFISPIVGTSKSALHWIVRVLLAGLATLPLLAFPDWDALDDKLRPFHLYSDASTNGLDTTLEGEYPDGSNAPIGYITHTTVNNDRHWSITSTYSMYSSFSLTTSGSKKSPKSARQNHAYNAKGILIGVQLSPHIQPGSRKDLC